MNDLIDEQDEAKAYREDFFLWPKMWREYVQAYNHNFNWEIHPFDPSEIQRIPDEIGLYTFVIQPSIALHPACSYLMYVGLAEDQSLRERFGDYLQEKKNNRGRRKIYRLLNKYPDNLFFCCTRVQGGQPLESLEKALICAYIPPCNTILPARVSRVIGALR
jgi:hypothetical protein